VNLRYHKSFQRQFLDLNARQQRLCERQIGLFEQNPFDRKLNNHPLRGRYVGYRSINVGGDRRAIFRQTGDDVTFIAVGTHSQLYG
jgi:addiction module RelE/StbE family toxin